MTSHWSLAWCREPPAHITKNSFFPFLGYVWNYDLRSAIFSWESSGFWYRWCTHCYLQFFNVLFVQRGKGLSGLIGCNASIAIFLVSGRGIACQQEISLVLAKTLSIHYWTVMDSASITRPWWIARSPITRDVAYLTHMNSAHHVTHLYANGIHVHDESQALILVSWIETYIFI